MNFKRFFFLIVVILAFVSCRSKKNVLYFQNTDTMREQTTFDYEPKIQVDDILMIKILALDAQTVAAFNMPTENNSISGNNLTLSGYLVDSSGFIEFPVLGKIKVAGYTKSQLFQQLQERLAPYVTKPTINLRILNFKVTVLGEVNSPGTYTFDSERVTLPQLFSKAGDLSQQSVTKNILLIREVDGKKTFNRIDFTQADIVNSPYYYLAQNDVVYIEPRKNKIDSGAIPPALINTISVFTVLLTTLVLIKTIN